MTTAGKSRRLTRRHLVLLALVPVLCAVWVPVLTGGSRRPPPAPVPKTSPVEPGAATEAPPAAPTGEVAAADPADASAPLASVVVTSNELTQRLAALATPFQPRWTVRRSDPFQKPPAAVTAAAPAPSPSPSVPVANRQDQDLAPAAVLLSPGQQPLAIIGGRTYRPGDDVAGHTIVAIEERRVVFRRADQTFAVSMPAPSLGQEPDHD